MVRVQVLLPAFIALFAIATTTLSETASPCTTDGGDCNAADDVVELLQESSGISRGLKRHAALATLEKNGERPARFNPLISPSVLITGTGDSGTRGVARACQKLGMYFCESCKNEVEDNMPSFEIGLDMMVPLLMEGKGRISPSLYKKNKWLWDATMQKLAVTNINTTAQMKIENPSLTFEGLNWGIKVPSHFYLLPLYDVAFADTKYLMVSRDPRDTCTNQNQRNFHLFGPFVEGSKAGTDCWGFYASIWTQVFELYETDPRFKVVRVEDLVVPDPTQEVLPTPVLNCVANFVELPVATPEVALDILSEGHQYNTSYMGHHYNMTDSVRAEVEADLSSYIKTSVEMQTVMKKLGYDFDHYGLGTPSSLSVCK